MTTHTESTTTLLPFQPATMKSAQVTAVSNLARYCVPLTTSDAQDHFTHVSGQRLLVPAARRFAQ